MKLPRWFSKRVAEARPQGTFVVDAEIHRTEDLRPDVLGVPSEDEVRDDRPHDPWRPSRTLGPMPKH
jgi:hypothetical protein